VAAVMASLVSVAYYLKIVVAMYMQEGGSEPSFDGNDPALYLVVFLCLFGVLELGLWPGNLLTIIRQALTGLF